LTYVDPWKYFEELPSDFGKTIKSERSERPQVAADFIEKLKPIDGPGPGNYNIEVDP
jgi:hypothetical protein